MWRGLDGLSGDIIHESPWLQELRQIEAVHPQVDEHPFAESRHYFLTFHDSSLEAIATDLVVVDSFVSMADAITEIVRIANPG
jgi:hypothetical protein